MNVFSSEIILMLSTRIKEYRIDYPMTQKQLAEKSGISLRSIQMFEKGNDMQLSNFIKIVNALGLADNFYVLIPDISKRPSKYVKTEKKKKRVRIKETRNEVFKWGDE